MASLAKLLASASTGKTTAGAPSAAPVVTSGNFFGSPVGGSSHGFLSGLVHDVEHPINDLKGVKNGVESAGKDLYPRLMDILQRGQYASADTARSLEDTIATVYHHPTDISNDISAVNKGTSPIFGGLDALWAGISGKQKGNYEGVIQHGADLIKEHGDVAAADAHPGIAHVNKYVKSIGGLAGDIFLDPTTYLGGAGLIGKVGDVGKVAELADKTAVAGKSAQDLGLVKNADEFATKVGAKVHPAGFIKKSAVLSPEDVTSAFHSYLPDLKKLATDNANKTWENAVKQARSEVPVVSGDTSRAARVTELQVNNRARELTGGFDRIGLQDHFSKTYEDLLREHLNPKTTRALGVTFAGKKIVHIPVESLVSRVEKLSDTKIGKAGKVASDYFNTHVPAGLRHLRASEFGGADRLSKEYDHALTTSTANGGKGIGLLDRDTNKALLDAHSKGLSTIMPEEQDRLNNEINEIQDAWNKEGRKPSELNRYLAPKYKIPKEYNNDEQFLQKTFKHHYAVGAAEGDKAMQNVALLLHQVKHAELQATAHKATFMSAAHGLGHATHTGAFINKKPIEDATTANLIKHGYRQALDESGKAIKGTETHVFSPENAKNVEALHHMLSPDNLHDPSGFLHHADQAVNIWKRGVTEYRPGYHIRNLVTEMANSHLAGVNDPRDYEYARRILGNRNDVFGMKDPESLVGKTKDIPLKKPLIGPDGKKITSLSTDEFWHYYNKNGLKTGFFSTSQSASHLDGPVSKLLHKINVPVQKASESIEDYTRLAHFVSAVRRHGGDLDKALRDSAIEVRKFHFDYSDFTKFEKGILSRAFPFIKWTKKNMVLQSQMLLAKPGKFAEIPKGLRAIQGMLGQNVDDGRSGHPGAILPSWLQHDGGFKIGGLGTGNAVFGDPASFLPQTSAIQEASTPVSTLEGLLTPLLSAPYELNSHKTLQGYPTGTSLQTLLSLLPSGSLANSVTRSSGRGQHDRVALAQWLTGLQMYENTPKRQQSSILYGGK